MPRSTMSAASSGACAPGALDRLNDHVQGLGDGFPQITSLQLNRAETRQQAGRDVHHRLIELVIGEGRSIRI